MKPTRINSLGFSPLAAFVRLRKRSGAATPAAAAREALLAVRRNWRREKARLFNMAKLFCFKIRLSILLAGVLGRRRSQVQRLNCVLEFRLWLEPALLRRFGKGLEPR